MTDVRAHITRSGKPDLSVHVGAVHVDLSAMGVDDLANPLNPLFEDTVRRRVGDHQSTE